MSDNKYYYTKVLHYLNRLGLTIPVIKTALGAGIAWGIALEVTQNQYPYFAPLAAVLVGQVTVVDCMRKAINRTVGVIVGVIVSMLLGHWLNLSAFSVFLVVLVGMAMSTAVRLNSFIISQVAVSSLLVLSVGYETIYALDRIVETILGSAVAIAINALIVPPNEVPKAEKQLAQLSTQLAATLRNLSHLYKLSWPLAEGLTYARNLAKTVEATANVLKLADESSKYSPFRSERRERVEQLKLGLSKMERITIEVRGIARGLHDSESCFEPKECLVEALEATANCIEAYGQTIVFPEDQPGQCLTQAIVSARSKLLTCIEKLDTKADATKSVEIGSILADLNRIIREIELNAELMPYQTRYQYSFEKLSTS